MKLFDLRRAVVEDVEITNTGAWWCRSVRPHVSAPGENWATCTG
jgi:hypothetical protein